MCVLPSNVAAFFRRRCKNMAKICYSKREREKGTKELIVVVVVPTERVQHYTLQ